MLHLRRKGNLTVRTCALEEQDMRNSGFIYVGTRQVKNQTELAHLLASLPFNAILLFSGDKPLWAQSSIRGHHPADVEVLAGIELPEGRASMKEPFVSAGPHSLSRAHPVGSTGGTINPGRGHPADVSHRRGLASGISAWALPRGWLLPSGIFYAAP